jgi:hypothetical protein
MVKNYLTHEVKGDKKKAIAELWKIKVGWVIKQTPCSVQIISGHVEERVMATPCLSEWEIRDQKSKSECERLLMLGSERKDLCKTNAPEQDTTMK